MLKRHEDQSYFIHITLINFIPLPEKLVSINKKSLLNASIIRDSITPMFVSEEQIISTIDSPIKPFAFQGKISLSEKTLRFSIKLSDLNKNSNYFLKLEIIDNVNKTEFYSFKLYMNKYIESFKVEQKNYFEEHFFEKNGSHIETEVYIETNRAALEYLLADIKSEKRKKRSLSIKKNREAKNAIQKEKNALTIEKLHKEAEDMKNLKKLGQQNPSDLVKTAMKNKNIRDSAQSFDEYDELSKLDVLEQTKDEELNRQKNNYLINEDKEKSEHSLFVNRKAGEKFYGLEMSKITEVLNSENHSDMSKTNILEAFSRERQNLRRTDYSEKLNSNTDRILEAIDMSQPTASVISSILQENPSLHADIGDKKFSEINMNESGGNLSSIANSFESFMSRSFIEADDGDEVSLVHSSELSVRTEVETMKVKRNKYIYLVMAVLAFVIICWLMIPTSHHVKYMENKTKKNKKLKK